MAIADCTCRAHVSNSHYEPPCALRRWVFATKCSYTALSRCILSAFIGIEMANFLSKKAPNDPPSATSDPRRHTPPRNLTLLFFSVAGSGWQSPTIWENRNFGFVLARYPARTPGVPQKHPQIRLLKKTGLS